MVDFEPVRTLGLLVIAKIDARLSARFGREMDLVACSAVEQSRNYIRSTAILYSAKEVSAT